MKNAVFWDVTSCGSLRTELLVTANVVASKLILSTLMMKAILSSEASVLTSAAQSHIP
jgi:hypothetical protein